MDPHQTARKPNGCVVGCLTIANPTSEYSEARDLDHSRFPSAFSRAPLQGQRLASDKSLVATALGHPMVSVGASQWYATAAIRAELATELWPAVREMRDAIFGTCLAEQGSLVVGDNDSIQPSGIAFERCVRSILRSMT